MLNFDFGECVNSVDYRFLEQRVNGFTQIEMEQHLNICEDIVSDKNSYDYEIEEAKAYIDMINEKMLEIPSSQLVCI